ncbi:MAG: transglycosylase domain-containing protein [Coriobacteriia bacterium]|nr:transglycosylase domain-containing protein [Coriobacteriia bacterium]
MPYLSRNARSHHRSSHKGGKIFAGVLLTGLIITCVAGVAGAAYVSNALKTLPKNYKSADAFVAPEASRIYSVDGKLLARVYIQNRQSVDAKQMGKYVRNATVAVEDERFLQHGGIDPAGIIRAAVTGNGGGSTLTQQYVRQTILADEATQQTLARKIREAYLAMQVEKKYSKDEVLTMYLNTVYYGESSYGVEAAAQTYFSKDASQLTLAEAALLAGLPQRPSGLNPYKHLADAKVRRNHVLDRMLANKYITKDECDKAKAEEIKLKRSSDPANGIYAAPYFVSDVKSALLPTDGSASPYNLTYNQLVTGGLVIKTSLDSKMQGEAEASMRDGIGDSGPEGALVTINPKNGFVQAMVGGRDFSKNQINLANNRRWDPKKKIWVGGRQPGSTFKAFTLTTAIEAGMSPSASVSGSEVKIPANNSQGYWDVHNSEGRSQGQLSVAQATYASVNGAYARIEMALGSVETGSATSKENVEIGAQKVAAVAKKMGVRSLPLDPVPSLTLGGDGCTVQDIASGFSTLANNGVYCPPVKIVSITDRNGVERYNYKNDSNYTPQRVLTPSVACAVVKILQGVVSGGTGTPARIPGRQIAGKTGTTNSSNNLWFTGFTPNFCTSIWRGWRDKDDTVRINGRMGYGGPACGPIWKSYAKKVFETLPKEDFLTAPAPPYNNSQFKFFGGSDKAPRVIGLDYQAAFDKLRAAGFTVNWIQVPADAPRGTVIAQSAKGNKVTLTVSLGGGSGGGSKQTTGTAKPKTKKLKTP